MLEKLKKILKKLNLNKTISYKKNQNLNIQKTRKKLSKHAIITIVACSVLVLTHIAIILAIILSFRYYSIYPSLFGSIVAIVLCLLIIVDIIFFIGFNHKDLALKIISCTLSVLLLIGGTVGTVFIGKANGIVDSVLDDGSQKYETYSGIFVSYDKFNTFTSLTDLQGKSVGMLAETSDGISYIAKSLLSDAGVDYGLVEFKTNAELLTALVDGDIDAAVITSAYRTIYDIERDENSPFAQYLDNFIDFYSFEQELKVVSNKKAKNVTTDPFNVLLIGYSRTDIGSTVGLADSIIVATINPQTYTVSMMSIARDSFVPISCYGGEYDKINSGRSTSRACFIETVEDFLDMDIDYYMELDYLGLVQIVNTIGGVKINNPVDFELDGIYVPAGNYTADGQQALQFCRERHHMPNGDFDRQQHQKEVIIAIAKKFIESGDITLALDAMESASEWMSTDLTLNQLTTIFNLLLNTKNYTSLDTFDLVDFQTLRITGSGGIKYYSYSMSLPLWVYLIYQGSYDESMQHLYEVMGQYETYEQEYKFEFSATCPYIRDSYYSEEYDDVFMYTPDPMPAYWANLEGMTLQEAMAWASENGVTLTVEETIQASDERYDEEQEGLVVDQSVRYGALISNYSSGTITVMGAAVIDENKVVPDFVGHSYSKAKSWAYDHDIYCSIDFDTDVDGEVGDVVSQSPKAYTDIEEVETLEIVVKAGEYKIKFDKNGHGDDEDVPDSITVITGDKETVFEEMDDVEKTSTSDGYNFLGWFTSASGGTQVYDSLDVSGDCTVYAQWEKVCSHTWDTTKTGVDGAKADSNGWYVSKVATCTEDGTKTRVCSKCGKTETQTIAKLGHTWVKDTVNSVDATCTENGNIKYTCSTCNAETSENVNALGHDWETTTVPSCDNPGLRTCKRCSTTEELDQLTDNCTISEEESESGDTGSVNTGENEQGSN